MKNSKNPLIPLEGGMENEPVSRRKVGPYERLINLVASINHNALVMRMTQGTMPSGVFHPSIIPTVARKSHLTKSTNGPDKIADKILN